METGVKVARETEQQACPLDAPVYGRVPGVLALVTAAVGLFTQPAFFGLAAGLLAVLSLLLSPARCRWLGLGALAAACTVGLRAFF